MIRLDKYLADTGAASRREAKMYIRRGEVTVDGVPAAAPEQKIAETAVVCLRGQPLHYQTYHYYMLHKPSGVLTATSDRSQPTVLDLFPPELQRFGLVPAGRLDKDTTGLIVLTNDGVSAHNALSPKRHVEKKYYFATADDYSDDDISAITAGITLKDGYTTKPCKIDRISEKSGYIYLTEGKYHEIKRLFGSRGNKIIELERVAFGSLTLGELKPSEWRFMTDEEISAFTAK